MKIRILVVTPLSLMEQRHPGDKRPNVNPNALIDRETLGAACLVHGRAFGLQQQPELAVAADPADSFVYGALGLQRGFYLATQWPGLPEVLVESSIEASFDPIAGSGEATFQALIARLAGYSQGENIVLCSALLPGWIKNQYGVEITAEGPLLVEAEMGDDMIARGIKIANLNGFSAERARVRTATSMPFGAANLAVRPLPPAPATPEDAHYEEISVERALTVASPDKGTVVLSVDEVLAAESAPQA